MERHGCNSYAMTRRCGAGASRVSAGGDGESEAREAVVNGAESGSVVLGSGEGLRDVLSELAAVGGEEEQEWQEQALCAQTDPEAFFPEKGGSTREAKQICHSCDVRSECLEYALGHDERFGIWGGLSERERRRLKRRVV
jgi:WhiB family redox-sensing transcriptional regulator